MQTFIHSHASTYCTIPYPFISPIAITAVSITNMSHQLTMTLAHLSMNQVFREITCDQTDRHTDGPVKLNLVCGVTTIMKLRWRKQQRWDHA